MREEFEDASNVFCLHYAARKFENAAITIGDFGFLFE